MKNTRGVVVKEVMLIDDEPIDLFISEKLLSAVGFCEKFIVCREALSALKILEDRLKKGVDLPQVVFVDYFMPQVDGRDFLEKVGEIEKTYPNGFNDTKFVILTSLKAPEKRKNLAEMEKVYRIVSKPINEKSVSELSLSFLQQNA